MDMAVSSEMFQHCMYLWGDLTQRGRPSKNMAYREQPSKSTPGPNDTAVMGVCHQVPCFSTSLSPDPVQSWQPQHCLYPASCLSPQSSIKPHLSTASSPPGSPGRAASTGRDVMCGVGGHRGTSYRWKQKAGLEISIASLFSNLIEWISD